MKPSLVPFILLVELVAIWFVIRRARQLDGITSTGASLLNGVLFLLIVWVGATTWLALNGTYQSDWFLASWPPFWVNLTSAVIIMVPIIVSRAARDAFRGLIDVTPLHWLIGFQAIRILAIGGVFKAYNGDFTAYFAYAIGIPDMLFGLSAVFVAWLAYKDRIGSTALVVWNLVGFGIIVPIGVILIQMGLPGPWLTFTEPPTMRAIYEFPMALAPTIVVPLLVMMNLLIAIRLVERGLAKRPVPASVSRG